VSSPSAQDIVLADPEAIQHDLSWLLGSSGSNRLQGRASQGAFGPLKLNHIIDYCFINIVRQRAAALIPAKPRLSSRISARIPLRVAHSKRPFRVNTATNHLQSPDEARQLIEEEHAQQVLQVLQFSQ